MASGSEEEDKTVQAKVVVLGDGAVGKTSLIRRFCDESFEGDYKQTIGLSFFKKNVQLPSGPTTVNTVVSLQIWDIGGQSLGSRLITNYIHGASAVLLCYDITSFQSLQHLSDWLGVVKQAKRPGDTSSGPFLALVGTKSDLAHLRTVKVDKHRAFAEENGMKAFFTSAKTGDQVNQMFFRVAADIAGVTLTRPDTEVASRVVTATIIDHPLTAPEDATTKRKRRCVIQ